MLKNSEKIKEIEKRVEAEKEMIEKLKRGEQVNQEQTQERTYQNNFFDA